MKIREKIEMDLNGLIQNGPITIVAFGDSVTHGSLGHGEINYETVYWNRLKQKLNRVRPYIPVNVINAGIGGITAAASLDRMDSQVFSHHPDLVIICFGLNDVNGPLEEYLAALGTMFDRCHAEKTEAVFMTPNMLNTYVTRETAAGEYGEYAKKTAEMQNNGRMDLYMQKACELAESRQITVCDCYSRWKKLSRETDTTLLLANGINHPRAEMHELFAEMLFEIIFPDGAENKSDLEKSEKTMYGGKQ